MRKKLAVMLAMLLISAAIMGCGSKSEEKCVFLDETLGVESYAIGFRVGDDKLAEQVSGAVQALVLDGTYEKIGEKYPEI